MHPESYQSLLGEARPVKMWTQGVELDPATIQQLRRLANFPFLFRHVAAMPDAHLGRGATVGSVLATQGAVLPAAAGVDLGCGMEAIRTSLEASDLPESLRDLRARIERAIPHGKTGKGSNRENIGSWSCPPNSILRSWKSLERRYQAIVAKTPKVESPLAWSQLATLGGGNHFLEVCLDEEDRVWVMLHSGSRGPGNRIGRFFIEAAQREMEKNHPGMPRVDGDLAYLREGSQLFDDYIEAVSWAQDYAAVNRRLMLERMLQVLRELLPPFRLEKEAVSCHHNYIARETHFETEVWVTRKGAVRAGAGELGIIPGSMGAASFIVRGKGNPESFSSCSHGAGRRLSRSQAKAQITLEEHLEATQGIECRKDRGILDESPKAYKDIDRVMEAQRDLVEPVHRLRQVLNVKG